MKKLLLFFIILIFANSSANAEIDYIRIYNNLEDPTFRYIHGIDPDQFYDTHKYAWSPYPLMRLNQEVYFKKQKIEPGYYLLTPREHEGKWYILFKENGIVKATIPCYKDEIVPELFYDENLPKEKLDKKAKRHFRNVKFIDKFKKSTKKMAPKTFLELEDLDNDFVSMIIYYGSKRYYIILRSKMN